MFPDKSSRRSFLLGSLGLTATSMIRPTRLAPLTVGGVIDRIKQKVDIPWREQTVDNLIVGSREQEVKGIAVAIWLPWMWYSVPPPKG